MCNSCARAGLQAARYRRRKARKLRTWTFSPGAIVTRLMRKNALRGPGGSKSLAGKDLRMTPCRASKTRMLRTWTFLGGGRFYAREAYRARGPGPHFPVGSHVDWRTGAVQNGSRSSGTAGAIGGSTANMDKKSGVIGTHRRNQGGAE